MEKKNWVISFVIMGLVWWIFTEEVSIATYFFGLIMGILVAPTK